MREPTLLQRLLREKTVHRYLTAVECADLESISTIWQRAAGDAALEHMLLEAHELYLEPKEDLSQEESTMEFEEGIHKSRLKGQHDEPAEAELVPRPPSHRKGGKAARLLQMLVAVLLIGIVVGGFLLIHNAHITQTTSATPSQKWCDVKGDSGITTVNKLIALAPNNVWATGNPVTGASSAFEHWDGSQWSIVAGPVLTPTMTRFVGASSGITGTLVDMDALSLNDIWAIGSVHSYNPTNIPQGSDHTLIEHWNGSQWQFVKSPDGYNGSTAWNDLNVVSASSATDVWAAGMASPVPPSSTGPTSFSALLEHWDGHTWSLVHLPAQFNGQAISSLAPVAPDDVWLVSYQTTSSGQAGAPSLKHWDGKSWHTAQLPVPAGQVEYINGVAAVSANDVWAFGGSADQQHPQGGPLLFHWDGNQWTRSPLAAVTNRGSSLTDTVAVYGTNNVWVAGDAGNATTSRPFLEHWDGRSWQQMLLPTGKAPEYVTSLASAGGKVWVVRTTYTNLKNSTRIETNC
jgi:hypothetical protein